jgi:hypothetical protein
MYYQIVTADDRFVTANATGPPDLLKRHHVTMVSFMASFCPQSTVVKAHTSVEVFRPRSPAA